MLRQVFVKLVANAVIFSSIRPLTVIESGVKHPTSTEIVVDVRDNDLGFDLQYSARPFDLFEWLQRAGKSEGTGISLATVRRIVHRHGGRTWTEGKPDKGATFYRLLPSTRLAS